MRTFIFKGMINGHETTIKIEAKTTVGAYEVLGLIDPRGVFILQNSPELEI